MLARVVYVSFLLAICVGVVFSARLVGDYIAKFALSTGPERPELGQVTGVVTLNDEPLANVIVIFQPEPQTAPDGKTNTWAASIGTTDSSGHYLLSSVKDVRGAAVGEHRVEIQVNPISSGFVPPPGYNTHSELV